MIEVDGSTYRGAGARMVVRADGSTVGAVSGGCLEADIVARAMDLIASGNSDVVHYDTRAPDDAVMGLGMGCQGVIDVRLESLAGDALVQEIARLAELRARDAVRLLVCGAGADAIPLVRLAELTGWLVTVADHRPTFAAPERFPEAERVVCINESREPGALAGAVALDTISAAVVMAHSAAHDRAYLHALLGVESLPYVGVLGPRRRTIELLDGAVGVTAGEIPARVYAPVGLDLGAESPEEIALSIASEIAAVLAGRAGGSLRAHSGPIHTNRTRATEGVDAAR